MTEGVPAWRREKGIPPGWLSFQHISESLYDRVTPGSKGIGGPGRGSTLLNAQAVSMLRAVDGQNLWSLPCECHEGCREGANVAWEDKELVI